MLRIWRVFVYDRSYLHITHNGLGHLSPFIFFFCFFIIFFVAIAFFVSPGLSLFNGFFCVSIPLSLSSRYIFLSPHLYFSFPPLSLVLHQTWHFLFRSFLLWPIDLSPLSSVSSFASLFSLLRQSSLLLECSSFDILSTRLTISRSFKYYRCLVYKNAPLL